MDEPYQGSSFTNIHEATGEPPRVSRQGDRRSQMQSFNPDPASTRLPGPPPSSPPPPPPDQAPPGYSSPPVSLAPPSFPMGNAFSPSPGKPSNSRPPPPPAENRSSRLAAGQQRQDPRSYPGSNDRQRTQTTSSHVTQRPGQPEKAGKLLPPYYGRGEELRNPSLRDLRGSRETLDDLQGSRQTLDARGADSVDFLGSRQTLDAPRSDYRGSREVLDGRLSRPPQGNFRGSGEVLDERNGKARAPAGFAGSRSNLNVAGSMAGSRDGLNDRSPPYHASRNSLSPQDVALSVTLDGRSTREEGLHPSHVSGDRTDQAGTIDNRVLRLPAGATVMPIPTQQNAGGSNLDLSGRARPYDDPSGQRVQDSFGTTPYLDQGQGRSGSGGVINLAMDDTISEEPEEVKAAKRSRMPAILMSRPGVPQGGMDSTMIMGTPSQGSGLCGERPLFMLWIIISVFLTLATLFIGLVPLIFFWQAREEWDAGNRGKAKNSLKWGRISLVLALLVFAGGIAGLVVYTQQSAEAIDNAYHQNPWYQGQGQGGGLRDYYGNLAWFQHRSDTYRSGDEIKHITAG